MLLLGLLCWLSLCGACCPSIVAWVVRGEVQVSVSVGGLSVDAYVKGSIVLVVEDCIQER